mmetsp:Transcript_63267/g.179966  ORF Transcript_63267/g.179966 Transcript_63267/m.179966 type:complete len:95 (-) Transcript_63267:61-345(-)
MARFCLVLAVASLPGLSPLASAERFRYSSLVHFTVTNPPKDYKGVSPQAAPTPIAHKKKKTAEAAHKLRSKHAEHAPKKQQIKAHAKDEGDRLA